MTSCLFPRDFHKEQFARGHIGTYFKVSIDYMSAYPIVHQEMVFQIKSITIVRFAFVVIDGDDSSTSKT